MAKRMFMNPGGGVGWPPAVRERRDALTKPAPANLSTRGRTVNKRGNGKAPSGIDLRTGVRHLARLFADCQVCLRKISQARKFCIEMDDKRDARPDSESRGFTPRRGAAGMVSGAE